MAVTGYKYPGTIENITSVENSLTWENASYAGADDTSYATCAPASKGSSYLRCTNYGFTSTDIPSGATIDGVKVVFCRSVNGGTGIKDTGFYLVLSGSAIGDNYASATPYPISTQTEKIYGGSTDKFNATLTQANILSSTFGAQVYCTCANDSGYIASVDYIKIMVYYTEAGAATSSLHVLTRKPFKHLIVR